MKSRPHLHALGAILASFAFVAASPAQTTPPPCPSGSAQKPVANPLAALSNSLSMLKQAVANKGNLNGAQVPPPANAANSPCTPAAGGSSADTQAAPTTLASTGGGSATQPWTPPDANASANAGAAAAGPPDLSKLPDVGGIRIGMSMEEAQATVQKLYPKYSIAPQHSGPDIAHLSVVNLRIGDSGPGGSMGVDLTMPPGPQVVYHVIRTAPQPHVARAVVLAALREKYGKETIAYGPAGRVPTDDTQIYNLYWVYDERGNHVNNVQSLNQSPYGCANYMVGGGGASGFLMNLVRDINTRGPNGQMPGWCASSYVAANVNIGPAMILDYLTVDLVDGPLMMRAARASAAAQKGQAEQARKQTLDQSQQVKPAL